MCETAYFAATMLWKVGLASRLARPSLTEAVSPAANSDTSVAISGNCDRTDESTADSAGSTACAARRIVGTGVQSSGGEVGLVRCRVGPDVRMGAAEAAAKRSATEARVKFVVVWMRCVSSKAVGQFVCRRERS